MILTLGWGDSVEMQPEMMCEHGLSGEWDRKWAFVEKKPQRERLMKKREWKKRSRRRGQEKGNKNGARGKPTPRKRLKGCLRKKYKSLNHLAPNILSGIKYLNNI